jgi:hypothetical protein
MTFVRATRTVCQKEKDWAEEQLRRYLLGVQIYRQLVERAQAKLLLADASVGKARANIRAKGFPVLFAHMEYDPFGSEEHRIQDEFE